MTTVEHGSDVNLENLRGQLAGRLGAALMVASVALIWVNWPQESFPFFGVVPLAALLGLGWGVHKLFLDKCLLSSIRCSANPGISHPVKKAA